MSFTTSIATRKRGFASIDDGDFDRMKWYGVYRQKPKDSGYFMMRTKIPGGQLNAAQAEKIAEIVERFAHGFCDITTRQTIQMHWLRIEDIPPIFSELHSVGITTSGACGDDTRNVVGCPVAGIDPEEIIDGTPQLWEVSRALTDNKRFLQSSPQIQDQHLRLLHPLRAAGYQLTAPSSASSEPSMASRKRGYGCMIGGGLSSSPKLAQILPVLHQARPGLADHQGGHRSLPRRRLPAEAQLRALQVSGRGLGHRTA